MKCSILIISLFIYQISFCQKSKEPQPIKDIADNDIAATPDTMKLLWVSAEYGTHSRNLGDDYSSSGYYEKISLEVPFMLTGNNGGMYIFVDRWWQAKRHVSFGIGLDFVLARLGKVDIMTIPAILSDEGLIGLNISSGVGYRILGDKFRLLGCVSYRTCGEISPGGGRSSSMFTSSISIGIALNKLLPFPHKH